MNVVKWFSRCLPGLSTLSLLILLELSLKIVETEWISFYYPTFLIHRHASLVAQALFILYSVFLHVLALIFPLRLCAAVYSATKQIEAAHKCQKGFTGEDVSSRLVASERIEPGEAQSPSVTMAIILPSYKEDVEILETSLRVLASHRHAKTSYDIFLAMEERDPNAVAVATSLINLFKNKFRDLQFTVHPGDIQGEAPGKSSNVSWAAKAVERKYVNTPSWTDVLITVMDSDSHLLSQYFELIFQHHLRARGEAGLSDVTFYMPPIVFDRNAHLVPRLVRMADLMWCGAGLSCFNGTLRRNAVAIPTSVYTLSLSLACLAGGWDTGSEAIGEDMHMLLKCYFATGGHLHTISIPSPASQCNVSTGKAGMRGWIANHRARYSQGLRHMWGSLDTGFAVRQWFKLSPRPECGDSHPTGRQSTLPSHVLLRLKLGQHSIHRGEVKRYTWRNMVLFSRLFEAHFLPNHLFLVLLASAFYGSLPYPISHCRILSLTLDLTSYMRAVGFALMTIYFVVFYERYHQVCIQAREQEMRRVGLYEEMENEFSRRERWTLSSLVDYFTFPISGTVFGSIPLLQAIVSHFWTDNLVYLVSAKPVKAGKVQEQREEHV